MANAMKVLSREVTENGTRYKVSSASDARKNYVVVNRGKTWMCGCPAWTRRLDENHNRIPCKHIHLVQGKPHTAPTVLLRKTKAQVAGQLLMINQKVATKYMAELLEKVTLDKGIQLLQSGKYLIQEKLDGYRLQIRKAGSKITGYNKKGKLKPVPANVAKALLRINVDFVMDGEVINDAYYAYDLLEESGKARTDGYGTRLDRLRQHVEGRFNPDVYLVPTWTSDLEKRLKVLQARKCEGAVLKLISAPYKPHRNGQHLKLKFWKSASCIVMEVRPNGKDSVLLGLYDGKGKLVPVGLCSTIGKAKSTVGQVVEVKYLYGTEDRQLYQAEMLGLRDDVDANECTIKAQMEFKKGVN
jgi:bifunctional non-homologous end joining protein LigD